MINIKQPREPYRIDVVRGFTVTVKPLTTLLYSAATISAQKRVSELEKSIKDVEMAGFMPENPLNLQDPKQKTAIYMDFLIKELAINHIVAWDGVGNEAGDGPAPCTPDNIRAVMEQSAVAESFFQLFTNYVFLLQEGKSRIRALATWHFKKNGGPSYCDGCRKQELPCAFENVCPYHVHAPRLLQEQQAWEIIEASITQMRVSPAGKILGLNMDAALALAKARNFDLEIVFEFLTEAERGILQSLDENETAS